MYAANEEKKQTRDWMCWAEEACTGERAVGHHTVVSMLRALSMKKRCAPPEETFGVCCGDDQIVMIENFQTTRVA